MKLKESYCILRKRNQNKISMQAMSTKLDVSEHFAADLMCLRCCFKLTAFAKKNMEDRKEIREEKEHASVLERIYYNSPELGSELPSASVLLSGEACS